MTECARVKVSLVNQHLYSPSQQPKGDQSVLY